MRKSILLLYISTALALTSCMQTRYITEQHIKTNIEQHNPKEFSTLKTYAIYNSTSLSSNVHLELTGYKYGNKKALVIGADKYYQARKRFKEDQTIIADITYIELSPEECNEIIKNYKILLDKVKAEKPKKDEEIYHDFTVSDDLFISYKTSRQARFNDYQMNLWIRGEKYTIPTKTIITQLNKFLSY